MVSFGVSRTAQKGMVEHVVSNPDSLVGGHGFGTGAETPHLLIQEGALKFLADRKSNMSSKFSDGMDGSANDMPAAI